MRALVVSLVLLLGVSPAASAQIAPLDAKDPSITKAPNLDVRKTQPPTYPANAREHGRQGEAKASLCIDATGKITTYELIQSTGHADLDKASLDFVKKNLRMKPAEVNGAPVAVCNYQFTWNWSLRLPRLGAPQ